MIFRIVRPLHHPSKRLYTVYTCTCIVSVAITFTEIPWKSLYCIVCSKSQHLHAELPILEIIQGRKRHAVAVLLEVQDVLALMVLFVLVL